MWLARTFSAISGRDGIERKRMTLGVAAATHALTGGPIMSPKHSRFWTFSTTIAIGLLTAITTASSGSLPDGDTQSRYLPVQAISYEFGSISINGYFTRQAATCVVMLTVVDRNVAEEAMPVSPVRVRMTLHPGQVGGLDSENGNALNVTCTEGASAVLIDVGERDRLADIQAATLAAPAAGAP
jgi:hypothetical protein